MSDQRFRLVSRRRRAAWAFGAAALLLLGSLPAIAMAQDLPYAPRVGYAHPGVNTTVVAMNLTDAPAYAPSALTIPSNSSVDIHLRNVGTQPHSFTLVALAQSNVTLNRSWTPAQLDRYFANNSPQANVSLAPNASGWANLTYGASLFTRSFEFVSVVPYQFQAGMIGFLNVSSAAPPQLLYENATSSLAFVPSLLSVAPPGPHAATTVAVEVTNIGQFPHTWTLAAESNVSIASVGYFVAHAPLANVSLPARNLAVAWANFTVAAPGIYEFVCTISGHFQSGMFGFLYVGVPVPPPAPTPSTAVVEVGVLVGALVLLGIGLVLAGSAGLVGRFERPPESGRPPH